MLIVKKTLSLPILTLLMSLDISHSINMNSENRKTGIIKLGRNGGLNTASESMDVATLPASNLKVWLINNSNITCSSSNPISLRNLERLSIYDCQINPRCITFGDNLHSIIIRQSNFTNGNIFDLLKTATNLRELLIGEISEFDLDSFPVHTLQEFSIHDGCSIISSRNRITFMPNLERFAVVKSQLNPHSIVLGHKLNYLEISSPDFVNGTIHDLVKNTANLETLRVTDIGDFDLATIRGTKKLLNVHIFGENSSIWASKLEPVHFPNLNQFSIQGSQINAHSITFSKTLRRFSLFSPILVNGSISDLLKTATNLEYVNLWTNYDNELDLTFLSSKTLEYMEIMGNWTVTSSPGKSVVFENLKVVSISECRLNFPSFSFSPKLYTLKLTDCTVNNGTISRLVKTGTHVETLELTNVGELDVASLPGTTLQELNIRGNNTLTWNNDKPIVLQNLEEFSFSGGQMNPHSIAFTSKLNSINLRKVTFVKGTSYDLLKTAINLEKLTLNDIGMKDTDISRLPGSETLKKLTLYSPRIHCSAQVIFPQLNALLLPGLKQEISNSTFCNFTQTFPRLIALSTSEDWPASPKFILQLLQSPKIELHFLLDLSPPTKSVEFDQVVKFLLEHGLTEKLPSEFFSRQEDFPESRFYYVEIRKWIFNGDSRFYVGYERRTLRKSLANILQKPNSITLVFCFLSTILVFVSYSYSMS